MKLWPRMFMWYKYYLTISDWCLCSITLETYLIFVKIGGIIIFVSWQKNIGGDETLQIVGVMKHCKLPERAFRMFCFENVLCPPEARLLHQISMDVVMWNVVWRMLYNGCIIHFVRIFIYTCILKISTG